MTQRARQKTILTKGYLPYQNRLALCSGEKEYTMIREHGGAKLVNNNGSIRIHSINTDVIGQVIVALAPKYNDIRITIDDRRYIEISYGDSEQKGADDGQQMDSDRCHS